jgi:hypothetical protein
MKREGELVRLRLADEASAGAEKRLDGRCTFFAGSTLGEKNWIPSSGGVPLDVEDVLYGKVEPMKGPRWRVGERMGFVIQEGVDGRKCPRSRERGHFSSGVP